MDTMNKLKQLAGKYAYVLIVIFAGMFLMLLPGKESVDPAPYEEAPKQADSMQENLEAILSKIQGVGRVQVLLTEAQGSRTIYVQDESTSQDSLKTDAVIITDSSRSQTGLVCQVLPPVYQGAVIVCQGGDDPSVRPAVVDAVCDATGLSADRLTVTKLK